MVSNDEIVLQYIDLLYVSNDEIVLQYIDLLQHNTICLMKDIDILHIAIITCNSFEIASIKLVHCRND